jgi:outer membrane protein OmpA-like peptidoglycan-associated protein
MLVVGLLAACGGPQSRPAMKPKVIIEGTSIFIINAATSEQVPIEIPFHVNSDVLDPESDGPLDALADFLADNPDLALVEVQGHSDERGTPEHNLDLSKRRAKAVVAYLTGKGVDAGRLRSKGYGANRPSATGTGETAWSQNRRVEFVIIR